MKKSLIALAVAGAFAAPAAFAATSNVDIYGKLHMSVNIYDDQADDISDVGFSSNASRIGFKGSEDLGGGLKGIWQVESGVNLDEQGGTWSSRNSFVGLSGNFGTVLLGNHDTPLKLVGRAVDLFGDTLADSRNVMGGGSDTRADNVAAYISPSFSGFQIAAAYTTDLDVATGNVSTGTADDYLPKTNGNDREDMDAWNINATYTNGPLFIGAAYGDGDAHETLGLEEHWRVAASYAFGDLKIVGQYDDLTAENDDDYTAWMVGAAYTMGPITLKANYMAGEYDDSDAEPEQWTIGADYALSKRTSVYALYVDGDEGVVLGKGAGASDQVGGADGDDVSALSVGVVHTF
jgi:predicted porin